MDSAISKVADAGLSSLFQAMFDTLTPNFLQSLGFLFGGVEGEAQKLKSTLSRIQALLNDAEARQIREESVRLWLRELKDAAYDAEDIVDEVECQVLRSKVEGGQMQTRKRKLTGQVSDLFSSSVSNLNMGPRIKEIRERLEEIESRKLGNTLMICVQGLYLIVKKIGHQITFTQCMTSLMISPVLYNLQTLILVGCSQLVELPSGLSNLVNLRHLSLFACPVSIPHRIGRLTSLQKLKEFEVGKENGYRINELKDMIHLQGSLCISELENVVNVEEAKEAELKNKQKIGELQFKWKSDNVEFRLKGIDEEVLSGLEPHINLQNLKIEGYCGVTFPTWLGDSSFSKLTRVTLHRCRCRFLPPFGQLPSLKYLSFRELHGLKKVGREFCGDGTVKGFPSLEILCFGSMSDLEEWSGLEGDISHVRQIDIRRCSKLWVLPCFPPTLTKATISECEKLAAFPSVPTICDLTLSGCDEQILSSLQYLTSLSSLEISEFPNLTSLPNGVLQSLTALKGLKIRYFHQLKSLSKEVGLQHLTSLRYLEIFGCPELTSIGDEVLLATLHHLEFLKCCNLNCLPPGLQNLTSLVILSIVDCPKIHSLPEELPTTLEELYISQCPILQENCHEGGQYWRKKSRKPGIIMNAIFAI